MASGPSAKPEERDKELGQRAGGGRTRVAGGQGPGLGGGRPRRPSRELLRRDNAHLHNTHSRSVVHSYKPPSSTSTPTTTTRGCIPVEGGVPGRLPVSSILAPPAHASLPSHRRPRWRRWCDRPRPVPNPCPSSSLSRTSCCRATV